MTEESKIALDCPCCGESIYQTPSWFRKSYSNCPMCEKELRGEQFDALIHDLEQAFDDHIDTILSEKPQGGGCCGSAKKDSCCGKH